MFLFSATTDPPDRGKREIPFQETTHKAPDVGDIPLNLDNEDLANVKVKLEPKKGYYDYDHNTFLSGKPLNNYFPTRKVCIAWYSVFKVSWCCITLRIDAAERKRVVIPT